MIIVIKARGGVALDAIQDCLVIGGYGLIVGYYDAARILTSELRKSVGVGDVVDAVQGPKAMGKIKPVRLATIKEVEKAFPGVHSRVQAVGGGGPKQPTTVYVKPTGVTKPYPIDFPSMNQAREFIGIGRSIFQQIARKKPGYRSYLRGDIHDIKIHKPGWQPKGGWTHKPSAGAPTAMFDITILKNGKVRVRPLSSSWTFTDLAHVPREVFTLAR